MRPQDKRIFAAAARHFDAWILVRRTNASALKYVGRPGYTPKRIDCKAKSADRDVGIYKLSGLVADPTTQPHAFSPARIRVAEKSWKAMVQATGIGTRRNRSDYAVEMNLDSKHYGCVTFQGKYIHADYDLYDIVLTKHRRGNLAAVETLHGTLHMRGPRLTPILKYINGRIGIPMVQHGGEMQYTDHSEQSVDVFGPQGQECTILNRHSLEGWYKTTFEGRRPLTLPK